MKKAAYKINDLKRLELPCHSDSEKDSGKRLMGYALKPMRIKDYLNPEHCFR